MQPDVSRIELAEGRLTMYGVRQGGLGSDEDDAKVGQSRAALRNARERRDGHAGGRVGHVVAETEPREVGARACERREIRLLERERDVAEVEHPGLLLHAAVEAGEGVAFGEGGVGDGGVEVALGRDGFGDNRRC